MNSEAIKQCLNEIEIKEHRRLSLAKFYAKKRLDKLRAGGFKYKTKHTEEELLAFIADCDSKLNPFGYQESRGSRKICNYPRLEDYPDWGNEIST